MISSIGGPARSEKPDGGSGGRSPSQWVRVSGGLGLGLGFGFGIGFWDWVPPPARVGISFWVWMDSVLGLGGLGFGIGCHEGIQGWDWDRV